MISRFLALPFKIIAWVMITIAFMWSGQRDETLGDWIKRDFLPWDM